MENNPFENGCTLKKANRNESVTVSTLSSTPAGTTMGLKERECGQMGVIMIAGTLGWIMEAPAATAYAVLPVGVDTIKPGEARERRAGKEAAARPVSIGRCFKISDKDNIPTVVE